jgi:hypothetical protein
MRTDEAAGQPIGEKGASNELMHPVAGVGKMESTRHGPGGKNEAPQQRSGLPCQESGGISHCSGQDVKMTAGEIEELLQFEQHGLRKNRSRMRKSMPNSIERSKFMKELRIGEIKEESCLADSHRKDEHQGEILMSAKRGRRDPQLLI